MIASGRGVIRVGEWKSASRRMLSATITVALLTALVKAAGAAKLVVMARLFGAGDAVDTFLIAFLVPAFAAEVIAASLNAAFIPAYIEARDTQNPEAAQRLFAAVNGLALAVLCAAALLIFLTRGAALRALASGFSPEKLARADSLLALLAPLTILIGMSAVWRATLNAGGRFARAAAAPAATPVFTILLLAVVAARWGAAALAAGALAGTICEVALSGAGLARRGISVWPRRPVGVPGLPRIVRDSLPVLAGAALTSGALLVDSAFAASLGPGSVSALSYGTKLVTVMLAIGPTAVGTVALPHFSAITAAGDAAAVPKAVRAYSRIILAASVPVVLALVWMSGPLVRILFQKGAFTAADARVVIAIQSFSFLQMPFAIVTALFARTVSSLKANRVLLWAAALGFVVGGGCDYVLSKQMGAPGIALARVVASVASVLYLARRLGHLASPR